MPLSKAQVLAAEVAKLEAALIDEQIIDKRYLIDRLFTTESIVSNLSPTSGGTPGDVSAGIDSSVDIELIRGLLGDIKSELINSKSIANLLIQDSSTSARYFIRQDVADQTTGTISTSILNLDGTIPNPLPVMPLSPVKAQATNIIQEKLYIANVSSTGYSNGDSISNIRLLNGETGLLIISSWYNISTRAVITTAPPIASLKGYEDKIEELLSDLRAIESANNTALQEIGSNGDISIPLTNVDPATLKGLIRRSNDLIQANNPVDSIGSELDLSIAATPNSLGSLKAIERGLWQTLLDIWGGTTDVSIPGINDESTTKGLLRLSVSTLQNLAAVTTNRSQFTRLTNGTLDLTIKSSVPIASDNAAVVALSPNSAALPIGAVPDQLVVGTIATLNATAGLLTVAGRGVANFSIAGTWVGTLGIQVSPDGVAWSTPLNSFTVYDIRNKTFITSGNITTSGLYQINVGGLNAVRVIGSSWTSGSATISAQASVSNSLVSIDGKVPDDLAAVRTGLGIDATGVVQVTGGVGIRGWLSGIFSRLSLGGQPVATSLAVAIPRKLLLSGITTNSTASVANMLDLTLAGLPTDVRDYNSGTLIVPPALLGGTWRVTANHNGSPIADDTYLASGVFTPVGTRHYPLNLQGINYIRVSCVNANAANVQLVLSQSPHVPYKVENKAIPDAISATLTGSSFTTLATGSLNSPSYQVEIAITAFSATTLSIDIQESNDNINWSTVYRFHPITAVGVYRSGAIPHSAEMVRYVENLVGGTITIARSIRRIPSLTNPNIPFNTRQLGGWNTTDIPFGGRCRTIIANNLSTTKLYVQVHNSTVLLLGAVPLAGKVFQLLQSGSVYLGVGDLGSHGSRWGDNQRVVLSLTASTYTPLPAALLVAPPNQVVSLHLEVN